MYLQAGVPGWGNLWGTWDPLGKSSHLQSFRARHSLRLFTPHAPFHMPRLRSLGVEDSLVQEPLGTGHPCAYFSIRPSAGEFDLLSFEEQLRALEAGLNGHDLRKLRMLETLSEHAYRMVRMHQSSITNAVGYLSFFRMVQHECREMKCQ